MPTSTEAGVGFAVTDGRESFPASLIGQNTGEVEMKIVDGSPRIRSDRTAHAYVGKRVAELADSDGFVDVDDVVELLGDRYHFRWPARRHHQHRGTEGSP